MNGPFLAVCLAVVLFLSVPAAWGLVLITPEEANRADTPRDAAAAPGTVCSDGKCFNVPGTFSVIETKSITGPQIKVIEPEGESELHSPVRLTISFVPKEGTQVDTKSFRLEYLKLMTINITDRVAQYVRPEGIKVEKADLPAGEHKLRITIKDTKGGITQMVYYVKIAK